MVAFTPSGEYVWANINWKARNRRWMYSNVPWPMKNMPPVKTMIMIPHVKRPGWSVHVRMSVPVGPDDPRTWAWVELDGAAEGLQPSPFQPVLKMEVLWQSKGDGPIEW